MPPPDGRPAWPARLRSTFVAALPLVPLVLAGSYLAALIGDAAGLSTGGTTVVTAAIVFCCLLVYETARTEVKLMHLRWWVLSGVLVMLVVASLALHAAGYSSASWFTGP